MGTFWTDLMSQYNQTEPHLVSICSSDLIRKCGSNSSPFPVYRYNWFFFSKLSHFPVGVHAFVTFSLSVSLSSLQALSCFFQLSTLAEDSCSASTSLALFSLKVCSSVSHFLALVLLSDRRKREGDRGGLLKDEKFRQVSVDIPGAVVHWHDTQVFPHHEYLIGWDIHHTVERCLN